MSKEGGSCHDVIILGNEIKIIKTIKSMILFLKNPWIIPLIYLTKKKRLIKLKNSSIKIRIASIEEWWRIRNVLLDGWVIKSFKKNLFFLEKGSLKIVAPYQKIPVLAEPLEKCYHVFDYEGKNVLDIGGFIGYSAALFSRWGAKRIISYEALPENCKLLKINMRLNNINGRIYNYAVSEKDGEREIYYKKKDLTNFGLGGNNKIILPSISIKRVLLHDVEIAKFDCEGCEYSLLSLSCKFLKKIPAYIVEYHHGFLPLKIGFEKCGFRVKKLWINKKYEGRIGGFKAELAPLK